ncbi:sugar phosphate isomerase/epimerase [Halogeometricum borinquense]|uniref:Sugar phosphate isomerase/epimerase n=1 Tax=Halogeometricum borinquense TaxID=60847 RepID=A0A6C0UKC6_9EURY|nr:sugar phosphate isomerase/epimerase family protein [Halogeometricum borinquense]QIB74299.1 sugar phosphate isomerase/epimerase [Halogeometricum borinquense]
MSEPAQSSGRFGASMDIRYAASVESFAEFLGEIGLNHVELRAGYLDVQDEEDQAARLRRIAGEYGLSYTVHAPHLDAAPGNVNERIRQGTVDAIRSAIDFAADIDAGGVIVHGGTARKRYPKHVRDHVRNQAVRTIRTSVQHAADRGVPLCLENQRDTDEKYRHTATPERLANFLTDVGADADELKLTLDVGHAKATGVDYRRFVDRFDDRIHVAHLHDNDGESDAHDPLPSFRAVAADIGATYNVLEMKSRGDVRRCVDDSAPEI